MFSQGQAYVHEQTIQSQMKDMMNSSAPICISNLVGQQHDRPTQSRGLNRRQTPNNLTGVRKTQPYSNA